ncbi:MAG: family 43 glycosylhydrolase [Chloroflexota bacterium]
MPIFFRPEDGWAADFIPFYWQGEYHLFYLKDYRDKANHGEGTPWFHLSTRDFVHFVDHGEALPRGREDEQDLYVFTGCAIEKDGLFHIFYTGHNPHFRAAGKPEQAIMHATSSDLIHWEKDPANPILFADPECSEIHDWRDPFVFWNPEAGEYWMLLAARLKEGPSNRRGITALAVSSDLITWTIHDPFWEPMLYFTHECPDLFKIGDWWYLIYSTFSERHITHYRMSSSLAGPWLAPTNDSFDGRAFYAAKTASDGQRRFAFGWDPTRTGENDTGSWNWGGHLVIHEVIQEADGSLSVRVPSEITSQFTREIPLSIQSRISTWTQNDESLSVQAESSFAWASLPSIPPTAMIETTVTFAAQTRGVGIILRADDTLDHYYQVRLESGFNRVVFDRCPRPGDEPPIIERPIHLEAGQAVHLRILIESTVIVAYVNDQVAFCTRGYEHVGGSYGLFVTEGSAQFQNTKLFEAL